MTYHVLPGDSLVEQFNNAKIKGETIVCREAFISGPIDADVPDEFWDQRARFVLTSYNEDEIVYHEGVADELERLSDVSSQDEVNLWFEYELFCCVNMWFCLSQLVDTGADIYRVEPVTLTDEDRWNGFGELNASQLKKCFAKRKRLTNSDIKLGVDLWNAFRHRDNNRLLKLADHESDAFPHLKELIAAAVEIETRPARILTDIHESGLTEFKDVFPEFVKRAGVYGFGDLQVETIYNGLYS